MSPSRFATSIFLTLSGLVSIASAQVPPAADSVMPRFTIGSIQTSVGYVQFSFAELDSRFAAAGLPKAASAAATFGLGADVRTGRLLVGAGFQTMISRNQSDAAYRTRMSGSYGLLDLGFAALRTHGLTVYPLGGVGATRLSLNVKERGDFTFDDGLQRPTREMGLSGTTALVHTGLLVEQRFHARESEYAVSLRVGFARSVGSQAWRSDDSNVGNGPRGIHGSYMRLVFSKPLHTRRDALLPLAGSLVQAVIR